MFKKGDLVRRTHHRYSHMVGVVVSVIQNEMRRSSRHKNSPHLTIMVNWTQPTYISEPEPYWVEDLEVISKAK